MDDTIPHQSVSKVTAGGVAGFQPRGIGPMIGIGALPMVIAVPLALSARRQT
jgi:hypothetical protein